MRIRYKLNRLHLSGTVSYKEWSWQFSRDFEGVDQMVGNVIFDLTDENEKGLKMSLQLSPEYILSASCGVYGLEGESSCFKTDYPWINRVRS